MSTTVFKGAIKPGTITARFMSDFSNIDSDLLVITFTQAGGGPVLTDDDVSVPGASANVALQAPQKGVLQIWVVTGQATDRGHLQVMRDGTTADEEPIQGPVRWVYAVQP